MTLGIDMFFSRLVLVSTLVLSTNCAKQSKDWVAQGIYGSDSRKTLEELTPEERNFMGPSVALVRKRKASVIDENTLLIEFNENLQNQLGICPNVKESQEISFAFCSGALVAPDIVLTAAHCIRSSIDCENTLFLLDNGDLKLTRAKNIVVDRKNEFRCESIIHREYSRESDQKKESLFDAKDFALVRLDRAVSHIKPYQISKDFDLPLQSNLIMIGNPNGIRGVYSEGQVIQLRPDKGNIITNLDAFQGNSGSAVLAKEDGALIGHLISGTDDYIQTNHGCKLPRTCPEVSRSGDFCQGEVVMNAERYKHLIHSNSTYLVSEQSLKGFEKITIPSSDPASEVNVKFLLNRPSVYMVSVAGSIGHFQVWKKEGDDYLSKGISKGSRLFNLGLGEYILGLKKDPVNALEASVQEAVQDNMAFDQQTLDQPLRLNLSPYSARYTRFSISQEGTYRISVFPDQSNTLDPFLQIFAREDNGSLRFLDEGDDDLTSAYPTVEIYLTHGDYALEISELSQEQGQVFVQIDPLDRKT